MVFVEVWVGEVGFDLGDLCFDFSDGFFHAFELALFFPFEFGGGGGWLGWCGLWGSGLLLRRLLLAKFFPVVAVVADLEADLAGAFEGDDVVADAVEEVAVVADDDEGVAEPGQVPLQPFRFLLWLHRMQVHSMGVGIQRNRMQVSGQTMPFQRAKITL